MTETLDIDAIRTLRQHGADAAMITAAIGKALQLRGILAEQVAGHEAGREALLLTASDDEVLTADQAATLAGLATQRIDALLPLLREDLRQAAEQEMVAATFADLTNKTEAAHQAIAALEAWKADYVTICALIGKGLSLHDQAHHARQAFLDTAAEAYRSQAVRDAGPLDLTEPQLPTLLPRQLFPNWKITP